MERHRRVILTVAVPLLAASAKFARRGSWRAVLVWFGLVDYLLYNDAFYVFGAAFNQFFLLYVALFTLPVFTLVFGLARLDVAALSRQFTADTPVKWISAHRMAVVQLDRKPLKNLKRRISRYFAPVLNFEF